MGTLAKPKKLSIKQLSILIAIALLVGIYFVYMSFAAATTMTVSPTSGTKPLGTNFVVDVRVNSDLEDINAVRSHLSFPADKLQFVSIDTTTSAFSIEAVNFGSNTSGTANVGIVKLERGTTTSVRGDQLIARVTFKPLATGSATINLDATSAVVRASDNINILTTRNAATYTISDTTAPTTPTGLTAGTRTVTTIPLTWAASTDNVAVTGYKVYRNGGTTPVATPSSNSFTDSGLTPNTSYSYTVSAIDAAGNESAKTAAVATSTLADTTAPSVPTGVTVGTRTVSTIPLSWTAPTDNVAVTGYRVYRNGSTTPLNPPNTSTTTSFTDTGLAPNTSYSYTVSAIDAAGNESVKTTAIAATTLADTTAPTVPTGLKVNAQNTASVTLGWNASTDATGVTGYRIYRNGATTPTGTSTTTSYTDTSGLVLNQTYTYAVSAIDAAGNESAKTATISVQIIKAGDMNRDGAIDIFDLSIILSNYGKTVAGGGLAAADINNSGTIDAIDLSILLTNYGT